MVTISKRDKANAARNKPIADKLLRVIENCLEESDTEYTDVLAGQNGLYFFDDRPKTYAWYYAIEIARYYHGKQQNQNPEDLKILVNATEKFAQALNRIPVGLDELLERYLSPEYDMRFVALLSRSGASVGNRKLSELERALLKENTNADHTIDADIIGNNLAGRTQLSERERYLVIDKLTGENGLDRLKQEVNVLKQGLSTIDVGRWLDAEYKSKHDRRAVGAIEGCKAVWRHHTGANPPQNLNHEAPGPFGRFVDKIFQALEIMNREGSETASPAMALRASNTHQQKMKKHKASTPHIFGPTIRAWKTDQ